LPLFAQELKIPAPVVGSVGSARGSGVWFRFLEIATAGVAGETVPGRVCRLPARDMFIFNGFRCLSDSGDDCCWNAAGRGGTAGVCCLDALRWPPVAGVCGVYGLFNPPNGSFSVDELWKKVDDGGWPVEGL